MGVSSFKPCPIPRHTGVQPPVPWPKLSEVLRQRWNRMEAEREVESWFTGEEYRYSTPKERGAIARGDTWVFPPRLPSGGSGIKAPPRNKIDSCVSSHP